MSEKTWKENLGTSTRDDGVDSQRVKGQQCPDESILLASTRQGSHTLEVYRHIETCLFCRQKYMKYMRLNALLETLGQQAPIQEHPEQLVELVFERIQEYESQRRTIAGRVLCYMRDVLEHIYGRIEGPLLAAILDLVEQLRKALSTPYRRSKSFRVVSIPVAATLVFVFVVVLISLALTTLSGPMDFQFPGRYGVGSSPLSSATQSLPHQPGTTSSQSPASTAGTSGSTASPSIATTGTTTSTGPTSTATAGPQPTIKLCSTSQGGHPHRLTICGSNFKPAHKVGLFFGLPATGGQLQDTTTADAQGRVHFSFSITGGCRNVPSGIYLQDLTQQSTVYSNVLQNISFANCPAPNSTPGGPSNGGPPFGPPLPHGGPPPWRWLLGEGPSRFRN